MQPTKPYSSQDIYEITACIKENNALITKVTSQLIFDKTWKLLTEEILPYANQLARVKNDEKALQQLKEKIASLKNSDETMTSVNTDHQNLATAVTNRIFTEVSNKGSSLNSLQNYEIPLEDVIHKAVLKVAIPLLADIYGNSTNKTK